MLNIIKKIWKNKVFLVLAILVVMTFPTTIYMQSDKDKTIVATSIGIDQKNEGYEVSILAVIPKGDNDINANLELFSSEGDSVSEALDSISFDLGKNIGLAHCDCIVFSENLMQENLTEIFDYFIRTANLSTNPTLIATPDSSKDLLEAVKSSNNLLDLSLKNIISSQEERTLLENVTIDRFYRAYFSPNSTFAIPILSLKSSEGSESQGGGSGSTGNLPEDSSGGSSSGGSSNKEDKKIENKNEVAIVRDGKFIANLNEDEKFIYGLLTYPSAYQKFIIEDINDENFINSTIVFQEADKFIIPLCKFDDEGKPYMEYNIWLSVMIDEVRSSDNHSYASVSGIKNLLTDTVKEKFHEQINEKLDKTISLMQENRYDILNLYSKFNAYTYGKFQDYLDTLDSVGDYMTKMSIKVNLKLNYVI